MNSFMSSIKSAATSAVSGGDDTKPNPDQTTNTELLSSAKLVADAAKCAASGETDKIDKPKAAGAAADILGAAKVYGKFDETQGVGSYLKKADDYLHEYEKSGTTTAAPPAVKEEVEVAPPAVKEDVADLAAAPVEEKKEETAAPPAADEKKEGFGASDAFKAAGSFFK